MAFQQIYLLPGYTVEARTEAQARWETYAGVKLQAEIEKRIFEGAGRYFLMSDTESGAIGFLKDDCDLAGFSFKKAT